MLAIFPLQKPELLAKWTVAVRCVTKTGKPWMPTAYHTLCSDHFLPTDYQIRPWHWKAIFERWCCLFYFLCISTTSTGECCEYYFHVGDMWMRKIWFQFQVKVSFCFVGSLSICSFIVATLAQVRYICVCFQGNRKQRPPQKRCRTIEQDISAESVTTSAAEPEPDASDATIKRRPTNEHSYTKSLRMYCICWNCIVWIS